MTRIHLASDFSDEHRRQIQALSTMVELSYQPLSDSPYFDLPNVIMTPHMAGISQSAYQRITDLFCENLRRYLADEELLNIVDKHIGY